MYAVVGCSDCQALWVVEGSPERSECPRCGRRRKHARRRTFVETDDADHAREVRASMLATRQGHDEAFATLESFTEMEARLDDAGPDDETYLRESGLDPTAIEAAGSIADDGGKSTSREEIVRTALRELDEPTEAQVVAYATDRGVDREYVERALAKFVRAGEAAMNRGTYRLL
ncbi:MAG: DUF5817 domain-containing protein [Haloarculaceae archaeon]